MSRHHHPNSWGGRLRKKATMITTNAKSPSLLIQGISRNSRQRSFKASHLSTGEPRHGS